MPPSDFAKADIDEVVAALTTDEAILLTAGVGFWYTHPVERLGVPAIKVIFSFIFSSNAIDWHPSRLAMVQMASEETISSWERQPNACRFVQTSITTFSP